jgi:acetoacetyl-CoA synthetase
MNDPLWTPGPQRIQQANVTRFMRLLRMERDPGIRDYEDLYRFSVECPKAFWRAVWEFSGVLGAPGERTVDDFHRMPGASWFPESSLNFAENLLRYRDDREALVFRSETGLEQRLSYRQLYRRVAALSAAMRADGIQPGDRVAGFVPNIPETVIAMLATTSIGAIWSSCSPDLGTESVVDRLDQVEARMLFCAAAYTYNGRRHECLGKVREIQRRIGSIRRTVVVPHVDTDPDLDGLDNAALLDDFADPVATEIAFNRLPFDHPVYILFSSGTTGAPKCITHGAGGTLLQLMKEHLLHVDLNRDDRLCYYTTCGWMMWNWLVNALATGCTVVLYDGSPFHPAPQALFDAVDELGITVLGVGAKVVSAWQKAGLKPRATHSLATLKTLLSTGSPLAPHSFDYVYRDIKQDLCLSSIAGGTDIVSCFAIGSPILPVYRGEIQCLATGMAVQILRDDGSAAAVDETGELCCAQPFPSMPVRFWGDDGSRYRAAYFDKYPGIWAHGDFARITGNGGLVIFGRSDATLNPGGVRIGTAEIYRQVERLDEVVDAVCIGQDWQDDVRIVLFVQLRARLALDEALRSRIRDTIRANTSPRHVPAKILQVADIPRTVSGKTAELAVRDAVHGRPVGNADALANPESLELFRNLPELRA